MMKTPDQALTRQTLHQLLWANTQTAVCAQLNLTRSALIAQCKKYDIPRPSSGYWTQRRMHKAPAITALPTERFTESHAVDLPKQIQRMTAPPVKLPPINVPTKLIKPEPAIAEARTLYKEHPYQHEHILYAPIGLVPDVIALSVSKAQFERALRILNTLLRVFKKLGWTSATTKHNKVHLNTVQVNGQMVAYRLREELKQKERPLSDVEARDKALGRYVRHQKVNTPTGRLLLRIEAYVDGQRGVWKDSNTTRIEAQLPEFIQSLVAASAVLKEQDKVRLARHQQWERDKKLRATADQLQQRWRANIDTAFKGFERWQEVRDYRQYLQEIRTHMHADGPPRQRALNWLKWASRIGEQLNPIHELIHSELADWTRDHPFINKVQQIAMEEHPRPNTKPSLHYLSLEEIEAGLADAFAEEKDT